MPVFTNVPEPQSDATLWTDTECVNAAHMMRRDRLNNHNMTVPRVVRGLLRLGYEISVADYKEVERNPYNNMQFIREGVVGLSYRVFEGDLPAFTNTDKFTQGVVKVLRDRREDLKMRYSEVAAGISDLGDPGFSVTADEYRTMEQGINKNVPVSVAVRAAIVLGIPAYGLLGEVLD